MTAIFTCLYGILMGYECSISLYNEDQTMGPALGYILIILLAPVATFQTTTQMVTEMVTERSNKMRESLKIMGLNQYVYAFSHVLLRAIVSTLLGILLALFIWLYNKEHIEFSSFLLLAAAFILNNLNTLTFVLVLQNFFENARMSAIILPTLQMFPTGVAMLSILLPIVNSQENNWIEFLFWLPTFPFTVQIAHIFEPDNTYFGVSVSVAWIVAVCLSPVYFFLHIYLENIVPNTFGVSRSCCYCFSRKNAQNPEDRDSISRSGNFNSTITDEEANTFN